LAADLTLCFTFLSFLLRSRPPPRSTLFPYTTLFRSMLRRMRDQADRGNQFYLYRVHLKPSVTEREGWIVDPSNWLGDVVLASCRSEEHTSELQSRFDLVCRLLLEKKKQSRLFKAINN